MREKRIVIDIDGTIATIEEDYERCCSKPHAVKAIQMLKDRGNYIILHTGRHINHAQTTIEWLRLFEIPYDHIQFGKPPGDLYIDDKGYKFESWAKFIKEFQIGNFEEQYRDIFKEYETALRDSFKRQKADFSLMKQLDNAMRSAREKVQG